MPSAPALRPEAIRNVNNQTTNQGQQVTINVYGSVVDHDKFVRDLLPSLENAANDGVNINFGNG
jgi:hypothetical protein